MDDRIPLSRPEWLRLVAREAPFAVGTILFIANFVMVIGAGFGLLISWGNLTVGLIAGLISGMAALLISAWTVPSDIRERIHNEEANPLRHYSDGMRAVPRREASARSDTYV